MKNVFSAVTFVLRLIVFSIVSWIVIHLMAVAGFFITAAYPIWGLLAPSSILCLFCRINQSKGYCPACKKRITNDFSPSSFRSIILNTVLIFIITLATIGVVYLEKEIVERTFGVSLQSKSIKIDVRSNRTIYQNRVSPVKLFLKGIKNSINAVQVDLDFNPDELEVLQFIEKDSFADIFVEKQVNNEVGFVRIAGGVPSPGYENDTAYVGSILVRPKITGLIKIEFLPSTLVLANDGKGSNLLNSVGEISLLVLPETDADESSLTSYEGVIDELVLGATEEGKLLFYDEKGAVFGAATKEAEIVEKEKTWWQKIGEWIVKIDEALLRIYERVFKL